MRRLIMVCPFVVNMPRTRGERIWLKPETPTGSGRCDVHFNKFVLSACSPVDRFDAGVKSSVGRQYRLNHWRIAPSLVAGYSLSLSSVLACIHLRVPAPRWLPSFQNGDDVAHDALAPRFPKPGDPPPQPPRQTDVGLAHHPPPAPPLPL